MFVKITASGSRRYVQLVESYRDEDGRVKKRTVATLGRADQLGGELDSVINGLLKVSGREPLSAPSVTFESARSFGDVWALTELWKSLGFSELRRTFRKTRHVTDVEALIRVMVFNRLCDPEFNSNLEPLALNPSLSGILCARHSMTTWSIYAKQDESEERGHSRQVGRAAEDPQGTA